MPADKNRLLKMLKELCEINSISGGEDNVRSYILDKIGGICECSISPLGNVIAEYKCGSAAESSLMISAHMDEVGMIVTSVNSDGTLGFDCVGGVNASVCAGRQVTVGNKLAGCVGLRAVHNLSGEEKEKAINFGSLYIDIGADDSEEALKYAPPGTPVYFLADYTVFGENGGFIRSKALDDRIGCAIMIELILSHTIKYDCVFTFVVQEEIGLRGGRTAAYEVNPDYAIVLEATTAADIPLAEGEKICCRLGNGPVISYMDRSTSYDRSLYRLASELAEQNEIPWQTKTMIAGGNDSGAIHISRGGVRTAAISVPCRYLHSPSCVIKTEDLFDSFELAAALADSILSGKA